MTARVFDTWTSSLTRRLEAAGVPNPDAVELAVTTVALIEGGFVLARAHRSADPFRSCARQVCALVRSTLTLHESQRV